MGNLIIRKTGRLQGTIKVPGDKSISHRALILGAIAQGMTMVEGFLPGADCMATFNCLKALGVDCWQPAPDGVVVQGRGGRGLQSPSRILDAGNSGTTMRLLLGLIAGEPITATITGDASLCRRPMGRVTKPLGQMGARIEGGQEGDYAPLTIWGGNLHGITYKLPVASAQVKSALLLAGLAAQGSTRIIEPTLSRDHTERMMTAFGARLEREELEVCLSGEQVLSGRKVVVPGDISSAAFLLVAGLLVPEGKVVLKDVGLNPTRTGIVDVLKGAGAELEIGNIREEAGEPVGDLVVRTSQLEAFYIDGPLIPRLVDEIPILALAATQAKGTTVIKDAGELRVKESDRIHAIVKGLQALGGHVEELEDGIVIHGPTTIKGTLLESGGDHRMAMTWAVAGLVAEGETRIREADCIPVSFPGFAQSLVSLGAQIT